MAATSLLRRTLCAAVAVPALGLALAGPASAADVIQVQDWVTLAPYQSKPIPAASCPAEYPYMVDHRYVDAGTVAPNGVELEFTNAVTGVNIGPILYFTSPDDSFKILASGSAAGSATNWSMERPGSVRVVLHCTSDAARGYDGNKYFLHRAIGLGSKRETTKPAFDAARAERSFGG